MQNALPLSWCQRGFPCWRQTAASKDHAKIQTLALRVGASFSPRFLHWNNSRVKESYCMIGIYCVSEDHKFWSDRPRPSRRSPQLVTKTATPSAPKPKVVGKQTGRRRAALALSGCHGRRPRRPVPPGRARDPRRRHRRAGQAALVGAARRPAQSGPDSRDGTGLLHHVAARDPRRRRRARRRGTAEGRRRPAPRPTVRGRARLRRRQHADATPSSTSSRAGAAPSRPTTTPAALGQGLMRRIAAALLERGSAHAGSRCPSATRAT